jgi:tetratricopeptide (TPR) repeat protein
MGRKVVDDPALTCAGHRERAAGARGDRILFACNFAEGTLLRRPASRRNADAAAIRRSARESAAPGAAAGNRLARTLTPGITAMLDPEEYFHLALHASAAGDHHACMSYIEEVLQRQPRNARAIYLLAVQHAELGLMQRAITGIKAALSIDPELEIARFQLGLLLMFDKNEPQEAKRYLERLGSSENRALRAYSQAMIAIADNEPALARQKLAIGLTESSSDAPLSTLMRRLFERMSNGLALPNACEVMSGPACDIRFT